MSTETMTDPAQTATPASDAAPATPSQDAQSIAPGTLKNAWSNPVAAPPAEADPAQAAPTSAEAAPAAAPAEGDAPSAPTGNREQLHRRVESRLAELAEARAQLEGQDGNKERARAIETELQVARNAMSGGWEHIGQIEAAHLSQWLSNTNNLIVPKPAAEPQS
jgi:hypothetical protein